MRKVIIPAIIAKSQEELDKKIARLKGQVKVIQLDVMDGIFVKNSSIDFDFRLPKTGCSFEAHLMVADPVGWIRAHGDKVDTIIAPIEAGSPDMIIRMVKGKGKRVGFALNPETSVDEVKGLVSKIDQVLVLSVKPGFYGGRFIPGCLDKVRELRDLAPKLDIEVDGGMRPGTIGKAAKAGANLFVSGSYTVDAVDVGAAVASLKKEAA
ncbi:ribulose-phosphate 3-epimerase [Candidatus Woesearchaeota archaeon]|nr:ribulose-phosphate 3-epimerase [Candidatus Woesearchaeota archaeon]